MTKSFSLEEACFIAARVHAAIESTFAHWEDVPEIISKLAFKEHLGPLLASESRLDYFRAMQAYIARLRNAHTEFVDLTVLEAAKAVFPIRARALDTQWYVTWSDEAGVALGDRLLSVNGADPDIFFDPLLRLVSASRPAFRSYQLFNRQCFFPDELTIEFQAAGRRTLRKDYIRHAQSRNAVSQRTVNGCCVLSVAAWDSPEHEETAIAVVEAHRHQPALIIDVRGNGGGDTPKALIARLMDRRYPTWQEATPVRIGLELADVFSKHEGKLPAAETPKATMMWSPIWNEPSLDHYNGQLVILADVGSKSATEDFLMPFKWTGRAKIDGETTAGSSGQPYRESPIDGCILTVGSKRQMFPDGSRFEGVGIQPDVVVSPLGSFQSGMDSALTAALALVAS